MYVKYMSPKTLFVCGFCSLGFDTYSNMDYLKNTDYFYYDNCEAVEDIEERLLEYYVGGKYTHLIGHSMGCFFISRMLAKLKADQLPVKTILMNPFIENSIASAIFGLVPHPLSSLFKIPKWVGEYPNGLTFKYQSIWSVPEWQLNNFQQINYCSNNFDMCEYIETYKTVGNVVIIYGTCDTAVAPLSLRTQSLLKTVTKFIPIYAKHEPFNDDMSVQTNLKNIFLGELPDTLISRKYI